MDAFSAQIVKFVREMPDEALLELVKQKLGVLSPGGQNRRHGTIQVVASGIPVTKGSRAVKRSRPSSRSVTMGGTPKPPAPASAERQELLDAVERVVKAGAGLSASEVARSAGIPQPRAAAALKELKLSKRIFQGGDRRFARYAGDAKTAEQASASARKTAKGPTVPSRKNAARSRKRGAAAAPGTGS
jgi:hypothetical protein